MHRREDIYGEDAKEFCPERWGKNKFTWVSFPRFACVLFSTVLIIFLGIPTFQWRTPDMLRSTVCTD